MICATCLEPVRLQWDGENWRSPGHVKCLSKTGAVAVHAPAELEAALEREYHDLGEAKDCACEMCAEGREAIEMLARRDEALEKADRHTAEQEAIISKQREIIEKLRTSALDAADKWREKATQLAGALREALEEWASVAPASGGFARLAELRPLYEEVDITGEIAKREALKAGLREAVVGWERWIRKALSGDLTIDDAEAVTVTDTARIAELRKLVKP